MAFMLRAARRLASDWSFLFQEIPSRGYQFFLLSYFAFCVLSLVALGGGTEANWLDRTIAHWVYERPILRARWCQQLTCLGDGNLVGKACAVSVLLLLLCRKWDHVSALLLGVVGEMYLCAELQDLVRRARPAFPEISRIASFSFPSGHTGAAVAFYGFWALFVSTEYGDKYVARVFALCLVFIAFIVGVSRIFLLAHWATDVLGAFAFAAAWSLLCFWVNHRMHSSSRNEPLPVIQLNSHRSCGS
jgi:membrane-associated phospholipid phosphatase